MGNKVIFRPDATDDDAVGEGVYMDSSKVHNALYQIKDLGLRFMENDFRFTVNEKTMDSLTALHGAATPGTWHSIPKKSLGRGHCVGGPNASGNKRLLECKSKEDADFIVEARRFVPKLIEKIYEKDGIIEDLKSEMAELREEIEKKLEELRAL